MNDPKEIAEGLKEVREWHSMVDEALDRRKPAWLKIRSSCLLRALDEFFPAVEQLNAALQAEREDGCRRVNDAIGDRDPIIENLKAELERVKAERDQLKLDLERASSMASQNRLTAEHLLAERDDAVRLLEPFAESVGNEIRWTENNTDQFFYNFVATGHCRAARAFVEKVK